MQMIISTRRGSYYTLTFVQVEVIKEELFFFENRYFVPFEIQLYWSSHISILQCTRARNAIRHYLFLFTRAIAGRLFWTHKLLQGTHFVQDIFYARCRLFQISTFSRQMYLQNQSGEWRLHSPI